MEIECVSAVSKVVVHARGALVTRDVTLPNDLPSGVVDLAIPGITLGARAGSVRAALDESEREVSAVRSSIVVPSKEHQPGASVTRLKELTAQRARLDDELNILNHRRTQLSDVALTPQVRPHDSSKRGRDALDVRFNETLAMAKLLSTKVTELDERIMRIERDRRELVRAIEAARLEDAQASTKERLGAEHPLRRVVVRVTGAGAFGRLSITYAVGAARWWPTYTLRIEEAGDRATWAFEALVAQKTGEDWTGALLALSSADLVFDARLPELASLRFGRAQPAKKRPPRPAPAGVDDMFAAYLAFRPATPAPVPRPSPARAPGPSSATTVLGSINELAAAPSDEEEITAVHEQRRESAPRPAAAPIAPQGMSYGGPPPGAMPMLQMQSRDMPRAKSAGVFGAVANAIGGAISSADEDGYGGGIEEGGIYEPQEPELVAGAQWSDLDSLVLAGAQEPRRGKLVPRAQAERSVESMAHDLDGLAKERWIDPSVSRGMFDHRYEAGGRADIPSDGRVHRVGVATAPCNVLISWRTVPSESPEVYREANVINPFEQALLGGPVDVYLDGSLLAQTNIDRIDRGGTLWCGMGVDDRVKVARNVRVDEESAGLLGGSLAVTHTVGIELTSSIKDPIKVVVLERVPVTDDKDIEIKIVKANPVPTTYDQSERGSPMRGGCRFDTVVNPGKKLPLEIVYRLVFSSKLDIVGGSRRG